MTATNSQLTIDLNSVSYCSFYYKNQFGNVRRTKPRHPTRLGLEVPDEYARPHDMAYPLETVLERLRRRDMLDKWEAICRYQFRNNHSMKFTGEEAIKKHQIYREHIYHK